MARLRRRPPDSGVRCSYVTPADSSLRSVRPGGSCTLPCRYLPHLDRKLFTSQLVSLAMMLPPAGRIPKWSVTVVVWCKPLPFLQRRFTHLVVSRAPLPLGGDRLSTSRAGGGWDEQTSQGETERVKAAEIETRASGSGPQQDCCTRQPAFARV